MGGAGGTNGRLMCLTFPRASVGGVWGGGAGIWTDRIVAFLVTAVKKKVQGSQKMSDLTARGNVF